MPTNIDRTTPAEPTAADVDARLRADLAALDDRIASGTLSDEHLRSLLDWIGSWHWPYSTETPAKLDPVQHAAAKRVAARAVLARGGEFRMGLWCWRSDGENLRAMAAD